MGSYTVYGGAGIVNVAITEIPNDTSTIGSAVRELKVKTAEISTGDSGQSTISLPLPDESNFVVDALTSIGVEDVILANGHIFIDGISAIDIGSSIVILLTAIATISKAVYDFREWRDRGRISRLVLRRAKAKVRMEQEDEGNELG